MNKTALGRRIHSARREQGITSERLSEYCNINATYLRQIESGMKTPSLPVFVTLCQQMGVSPDYLLAEDLLRPGMESTEEELRQLLLSASPNQLKLITAMIRGALNAVE